MDLRALEGYLGIEPNRQQARGATLKHLRLVQLAEQLAALRAEALAMYLPLPKVDRFHASTAKLRVLDGSNRSGKTTGGAFELCRMLCGCDPHDKYPKKNGRALVVGLDGDHLALMWNVCGNPGAFSIIQDEDTKLWRSVRPDRDNPLRLDPYDEAYREKWRDAPPLLPPRLITQVAWEEKAKGVPRVVKLANGWEALWRSSKGDSPQGEHWNGVWFDEHLDNEEFYREARRGIVATKETTQHMPRLFWTATPQNFNPQLSDLRDEAERGSKHVDAFRLLIADTPYLPEDEKQAFFDGLTEEEKQYRWYGLPAIAKQRVYPNYDPQGIHGCEPFSVDISRWARYVGVDPGRQHCGTVFFAVDPEEKHIWIYDAFDLQNSDALKWAGEVAARQRDMRFEAFVIDQQAGRQIRPGSAANTAQMYLSALKAADVHPKQLGPLNGFFPGTNDVAAREEALLSWLAIRGTGAFAGLPILQVMRGICPPLDKQFRDAVYRKGKRYKHNAQDILVCVEYMAGFAPQYRAPSPIVRLDATATRSVFEQFRLRERRIKNRKKNNSFQFSNV